MINKKQTTGTSLTLRRQWKPFIAALLLVSAVTDVFAGPIIESANPYVIAEGGTITLTGNGFSDATSARFLWASQSFQSSVNALSNTKLEVTMPDVSQEMRNYLLLVETATGSTLGMPSNHVVHTTIGGLANPYGSAPVIVESGAILTGDVHSSTVYVKAGGVYEVGDFSLMIILAEDGAVVDFSSATSGFSTLFFTSPDTVVIGSVPEYTTPVEITSLSLSDDISTFTVGYPLNLTINGPGSVTASPQKPYYGYNETVTLTAIPDEGCFFTAWSNAVSGSQTNVSLTFGSGPVNLSATFSQGLVLHLYDIPGGTVARSPSDPFYPQGATVSLTATADSGYEFLGWGGNLSGTSSPVSVTMDSNKTVIPVFRSLGYSSLPVIESADPYVIAEGGTITLTGNGFSDATSARFLWASQSFQSSVNPLSDTAMEVTMPDVSQEMRDYLLLVETATGSTLGMPSNHIAHATIGGLANPHGSTPVVVESGAILTGDVHSSAVYVKAGGVYEVGDFSLMIILAEDGAVVDFSSATSGFSTLFFTSPDTVVIGSVPEYTTPVEITSLSLSDDISTFTVGHPLNLTIDGPGSVTASPQKPYYRDGETVTLTAIPDEGCFFTAWSNAVSGSQTNVSLTFGSGPVNLSATFSQGLVLYLYDIPGGTVARSPSDPFYPQGATVSLTATADSGYEFLGWGGDLSGTSSPVSVTMDSNKTVIPVFRSLGYSSLPVIESADPYAVAEGGTITLTGTGFSDATSARFLWASQSFQSSVNALSDTAMEVTMPDVSQEMRDYLLLVETATGSTLGMPSNHVVHTTIGGLANPHDPAPVVVESGAILTGDVHSSAVYVKAGGVYKVSESYFNIILAEDGAVVDFSSATSGFSTLFFTSPDTVVIGSVPEYTTPVEITSLSLSDNIGTFMVGYPLNLTIDGPGSVTASPQKDYYGYGETITLTATPSNGAYFIRWIGSVSGHNSSISIQAGSTEIARFSTAPDYFSVWRLTYFTTEELSNLAISAFDADPDRDSFSNAAEYAFGSNPRDADSKHKIKAKTVVVDGEREHHITYIRPRNALDVEYRVLLSKDLVTWNFNGDDTDLVYSEFVSVTAIDDEFEEVELRLYPKSDLPNAFFVKISAILFE